MTRTHSDGHCGNAKVIPWQMCTCICDGNEHPEVGGYYRPLAGRRSRVRMTAVPTGPEPNGPQLTDGERRRTRSTFALAMKLVNPDLLAELAETVCDLFGHGFELQAKEGAAPNRADIVHRHELARRLRSIADDVALGRPLDPLAQQLFSHLQCEPTPEVASFFALILCGYLGDVEQSVVVAPCVHELQMTLLVDHVTGRIVGPHDRSELARLLVADSGFVCLVEEVRAAVGQQLNEAHGGSVEPCHMLCSFFLLLVDVLSIPGNAIDVAASTIERLTVPIALSQGRSRIEAHALGLSAKWLANYLGKLALDQLTVGGMKAMCQLLAVAFCPDLDDHPEVEQRCLRPLITEQLKQRLTASVKLELDKLIQNAA